ncbi:MAG: serine/threonine protein kinase [bacterium]
MQVKDYQITETIYEDVIGRIYAAKRKDSDELVCLKILHEYFATQYDIAQAFHRCAELYCSIENENCIQALGHGDELEKHYIILDHFDLLPLENFLSKKRVLSIIDAIEIIEKLASIIRFNHIDGNIHGQLTPQNILVDDNLTQVKITDFGFGEFIRLLVKKKYPPVFDLLPYYSPEFIEGMAHLDRRSDIFSLGVLFYRLLLGKTPWPDRNIKQGTEQSRQASIVPPSLQRLEIPDVLDQIILDTLEPKIENRCANLSMLLDDLSNAKSLILAGQSPTTSPTKDNVTSVQPSQPSQNLRVNPPSQKQTMSEKRGLSKTSVKTRSVWSILKIVLIPLISLLSVYILIAFAFDINLTMRLAKLTENALSHRISKSNESANIKKSATPDDLKKKSAQREMMDESNLQGVAKKITKEPFSNTEKSNTTSKDGRSNVHDITNTNIRSNINSAATSEDLTKTAMTNNATLNTQIKSPFTQTQKSTPKVNQNRPSLSSVDLEISVRGARVPQQTKIYVDGKFYGKTNSQGMIKISKLQLRKPYLIKVQNQGFEMWAQEVTFHKPGFERLRVQLQPLPSINSTHSSPSNHTSKVGTLTILLSNPQNVDNAFVYINGKLWPGSKNSAPLRIELPVGIYNVEVKKQGFGSEPSAYTLQLAEEEHRTLYFYLLPK